MALLQISEPGQSPAPHQRRLAIGIDLGTTHSLVAAVRNGVSECLPDAQGRVRIPQVLMREAGLHKDAMLVGMLNKFEIWDQERFNALQLEDVSDELSGLGITLSL